MSQAAVHARRAAIDEAVAAVRGRAADGPDVAMLWPIAPVALMDALDVETVIDAHDIPHLLPAGGHAGARLVIGRLEGWRVAVVHARLRRFEGHTLQQVAFPVRLLQGLGADTLILAAACSALVPVWAAGELMLVDDHINMLGDNPLIGPNLDHLGPRFPDMSAAYDAQLRTHAEQRALAQQTVLRRGVFAALEGPARATRAEYRMLRTMGADAVGTGIVPEVIAARHMGMSVLVLAVIAQVALPDALEPISEQQVSSALSAAEPGLAALVSGVLAARSS